MNRMTSTAFRLLPPAALAFLAACAPTKPKAPIDPAAAKCYDADSTQIVPAERYARMFEGVEAGGAVFLPCDTTQPASIRIRPVESAIAGKKGSVVAASINVGTWAIGPGLVLAFGNPFFLLIPELQVTPSASIRYRIDYPDSQGVARAESLSVEGNAWFKSRATTRNLLLEQSRREISTRLFGTTYPPKPEPWGRVSLNYSTWIFFRLVDGFDIEPRLEKFLPYGVSLAVSSGYRIPHEDGHGTFSLSVGPRKYFGKKHDGLFMGVEPVFYAVRDDGWEKLVGAPITVGHVAQHKRISIGISAGLGPGYRWTPNSVGQGVETLGVFDLNVGFRF